MGRGITRLTEIRVDEVVRRIGSLGNEVDEMIKRKAQGLDPSINDEELQMIVNATRLSLALDLADKIGLDVVDPETGEAI